MYRIDEKTHQILIVEGHKYTGLYKAVIKHLWHYGLKVASGSSKWTTIDSGNTALTECLCSILNNLKDFKLDHKNYILHHKNGRHTANDYRNLVLYPNHKLLAEMEQDEKMSHRSLHISRTYEAFNACLQKYPILNISTYKDLNYNKNAIEINKYLEEHEEDLFNFFVEDLKTFPYERYGGIDIEKHIN